MKFSIVIPTYNRAHLIEATLRSVMSSSYKSFEIIVVDDGSSDNTEEVVSPFLCDSISYYKIVNSERAFARNYGVQKSKGDYIIFLDSDDLIYENHLQSGYDFIKEKSFPDWFFCGYDIIHDKGKKKSFVFNSADYNSDLIQGNFLCCQSIFLKRNVIEENEFNTDRKLSSLEDWELWLRIAAKYKLHHLPQVTSALVQHDERSVMNFNKIKLLEKFGVFQKIVLNDPGIRVFYKGKLNKFKSSCNSYIALHLALSKENRLDCLRYFCMSLIQNPFSIFKRRTLAIFKHFI